MRLLILLLILSSAAQAQFVADEKPITELQYEVSQSKSIPDLIEKAEQSYANKSYEDYLAAAKRLNELRPHFPEFELKMVQAYALLNDKTKGYDALIKMQKRGLAYPLADLQDLDNLKGTQVYDYIEQGMQQNLKPYGIGQQVTQISKNYSGLLYENITWDSNKEMFLLGSVRNGEIIRLHKNGERQVFIAKPEAAEARWGVVDLTADNARDVLWVATASMPQYNGMNNQNLGESALLKYRLSSGELLQSFGLPPETKPNLLSLIHLTEQGDVFVLNSFKQQLYKLAKGSDKITPSLGVQQFDDIRAMTTDETGQFLYLLDFIKGVYVVDFKAQKVISIGSAETNSFGGGEELVYTDNALLLVQNGVQPARVMRLELENKNALTRVIPIEASSPLYDVPTNGVLVDNQLYYIANSQWSKMDVMGRLLPEQQWTDLTIMSSPSNFQAGERAKMLKEIEKFKKEKGLE